MQTVIDTNEQVKGDIEQLRKKIDTLKNKPLPLKTSKKNGGVIPSSQNNNSKKKKKTLFGTLSLGLGNKAKKAKKKSSFGDAQEWNAKQLEVVKHIQKLLLKEATEEAELHFEQHKKTLFGKNKAEETSLWNLQDEYGDTVLFHCIKDGKEELASQLLKGKKCNLTLRDKHGHSLLMISSLFGYEHLTSLLLSQEKDKDLQSLFTKRTALHFACENNFEDVVRVLLDGGCSPMVEDSEESKPHELTSSSKVLQLVTERMKQIDPNCEVEKNNKVQDQGEEEEEEELERKYGSDEEMKPLLEERKQLLLEKKRLTILLEDVKRKRAPRIDPNNLNLNKKAKVDDKVKKLHALVTRGNDADAVEEVEEMLTEKKSKNSVDKDAKDEFGETALMKAARLGFEEMLSILLLYKCNTEVKDDNGYSALMKAALFGKKECVKKLIDVGADLNALSRDGKLTALMLAAERNHSEICDMLIREGADHSVVNSQGKKAFDLCKGEELKNIVQKAIAENPVEQKQVLI